MSEDKITYKFTQPMRNELRILSEDTIFVADDGTVTIVPKGTVMPWPVADGPLKAERK